MTAARVLVAENTPDSLRLAQALGPRGIEVISAASARQALEMARREKPGLVVSDVALPGVDGYELCTDIKNDPRLGDVPVILMTRLGDQHEVLRILESRADQFVFKPCDTAHLVGKIQALLDQPLPAGKPADALEVIFEGRKHFVTADRRQLLELLLSTCDTAVRLERELTALRGVHRRPAVVAESATGTTSSRLPRPPFAPRSLRVLLIDDDPALLESLRSALQDEGHRVMASNGGQDGINAFRDALRMGKRFDIVITDLGMPYVDGKQVVTNVRAMSPDTPIILLTGWGPQMIQDQGKALSVDRLLGKPPRIRELRAALSELTGRRATDRAG